MRLFENHKTDLHDPVDQDKKHSIETPTVGFLATLAIGVPIWATVLVPLTAIYQIGKFVASPFVASSSKRLEEDLEKDSGYVVMDETVTPREKRKYDIVILGATGFTGRLAVRYMAKTYGVCQENDDVTWAIAGRSQAKLNQVKRSVEEELGFGSKMMDHVDTIIVDTSIAFHLPRLVSDTRAVVTTAGPFAKYGNYVVEFCAKYGTHYADITGETDWVKRKIVQWQTTAQKSGSKILSFCGCDCIPWDVSYYQMAQYLQTKDPEEDLTQVTFIDEFRGGISGGTTDTIATAVAGKAGSSPLENPFRKTRMGTVHTETCEVKLPFSIFSFIKPWDMKKTYGTFMLLSVGNAEAVGWTQALRSGSKLTYCEYLYQPTFATAFCGCFGLIALGTALANPLTAKLVTKYLLPQPGEGPTLEDMENSFYAMIYGQGVGTKGTKIESIIYYNKCAGYLETARMLVESGLSMALQEDKLPVKEGGFFTPSFALGDVLLDRLTNTGTHFQMQLVKDASKDSQKMQ